MSKGSKLIRAGRFERLASELEREAKNYEKVSKDFQAKKNESMHEFFLGKSDAYKEAARLLRDAIEGE